MRFYCFANFLFLLINSLYYVVMYLQLSVNHQATSNCIVWWFFTTLQKKENPVQQLILRIFREKKCTQEIICLKKWFIRSYCKQNFTLWFYHFQNILNCFQNCVLKDSIVTMRRTHHLIFTFSKLNAVAQLELAMVFIQNGISHYLNATWLRACLIDHKLWFYDSL